MKKNLLNKNVILILAVVVLIAVGLIVGFGAKNRSRIDPSIIPSLPVTDAADFSMDDLIDIKPSGSVFRFLPGARAEDASLSNEAIRKQLEEGYTASKYVVVQFVYMGKAGIIALPEEGEEDVLVPLTQPYLDENGQYWTNYLLLSSEGVSMSDSNCAGRDCIGEGMVTIENKDTRVLGNSIVCLPHQLLIELYSRDELIELVYKNMTGSGN